MVADVFSGSAAAAATRVSCVGRSLKTSRPAPAVVCVKLHIET
jgi:hypothetical protein